MPSEIANSTTDELRIRQHRAQIQKREEMELRDKEARHQDAVQRLTDNQLDQLEKLKNAYEVRISEEAESLEQRLHEIRMSNEERIQAEKQAAEQELTKAKSANKKKIEEYQKNAEAQLDSLRKQYQASGDNLRKQARKTLKTEGEGPSA